MIFCKRKIILALLVLQMSRSYLWTRSAPQTRRYMGHVGFCKVYRLRENIILLIFCYDKIILNLLVLQISRSYLQTSAPLTRSAQWTRSTPGQERDGKI